MISRANHSTVVRAGPGRSQSSAPNRTSTSVAGHCHPVAGDGASRRRGGAAGRYRRRWPPTPPHPHRLVAAAPSEAERLLVNASTSTARGNPTRSRCSPPRRRHRARIVAHHDREVRGVDQHGRAAFLAGRRSARAAAPRVIVRRSSERSRSTFVTWRAWCGRPRQRDQRRQAEEECDERAGGTQPERECVLGPRPPSLANGVSASSGRGRSQCCAWKPTPYGPTTILPVEIRKTNEPGL